MVMRAHLTVSLHSLPFKVRLNVFTLHPDLTPVAYLEPNKISPIDEAADCFLRDLERISDLSKREKFQCAPPGSLWPHLARPGLMWPLLTYNDSIAEGCQLGLVVSHDKTRDIRELACGKHSFVECNFDERSVGIALTDVGRDLLPQGALVWKARMEPLRTQQLPIFLLSISSDLVSI